jgi:hypothetical protein
MSNISLRAIVLGACVLVSACSGPVHAGEVVEVGQSMNTPASYDQRSLVIRGVLKFTSEGYLLTPECQIALEDPRLLVNIPRIENEALMPVEAFGSVVELSGKFVAGNEKMVNSRHKLLDAKFVQRIPDSACPERGN